MIFYHVSYNKVNHLFFFPFCFLRAFHLLSFSLSLSLFSLGRQHCSVKYIYITIISVVAQILIRCSTYIYSNKFLLFFVLDVLNKPYHISSSSTLSNENVRQTFQADVMASLLNAGGPLSLGRSGCWAAFFRLMQCLRSELLQLAWLY